VLDEETNRRTEKVGEVGMNITLKNRNDVPYETVDIGDVFLHGGCVYMVTDQQEEDTKEELKSVNLATGRMEVFGKKVMVIRIDEAELILS